MSEDILQALLAERSKLSQQLETVNAAIKLYGGSVSGGKGKKRGKMSAAHKAKLAAAQKKRWAAVRKQAKSKKTQEKEPKTE